MLDSRIQSALQPPLIRIAKSCQRWGIKPDTVTIAGFIVGVVAMIALVMGFSMLALLALLGNRLFDGIDGALARLTVATDQGAFLDITLDFIFYSGFVLAASLSDTSNAIYGAFLIFSFVANGSAFLAFAVFAEKHKINTKLPARDDLLTKSMTYIGGLAEGFETIIAFALICIIPQAFPVIACVFGVICLISAVSRLIMGYSQLSLVTTSLGTRSLIANTLDSSPRKR